MKSDLNNMGIIYEQYILNESFMDLLGELKDKIKLNTFINYLSKLDPEVTKQLLSELLGISVAVISVLNGFALNDYIKKHPEHTLNHPREAIVKFANKHPEVTNKIIDALNYTFNH